MAMLGADKIKLLFLTCLLITCLSFINANAFLNQWPNNPYPYLYNARVTLYEDGNFGGNSGVFNGDSSPLTCGYGCGCGVRGDFAKYGGSCIGKNMNDRTSSFKYHDANYDSGWASSGPSVCELYNMILCTNSNWGGTCYEYHCGNYQNDAYDIAGQKGQNDVYSSLGFRYRPATDNPIVCGVIWDGAWFGGTCCYSGNPNYVSGGGLCLNAVVYSCNDASNPPGTIRGAYICDTDGAWKSLQELADSYSAACTGVVGASPGKIFLTESDEQTQVNRCCGDDASDLNDLSDDKRYICTHENNIWKWLDAKEAPFVVKKSRNNEIISNVRQWYMCNPDIAATIPPEFYLNVDDLPQVECTSDADTDCKTTLALGGGGYTSVVVTDEDKIDNGDGIAKFTFATPTTSGAATGTAITSTIAAISTTSIGYQPYTISSARFLCHKEMVGNVLSNVFTQCCGPNYNYCVNSNPAASYYTRIAGGPTGLLKDYYDDQNPNQNSMFLKLMKRQNPENSKSDYLHFVKINNLPITNWTTYDDLEFDAFFAGETKLRLNITNASNNKVMSINVIDYTTSGNKDQFRWHHIRIPLSQTKLKTVIKQTLDNALFFPILDYEIKDLNMTLDNLGPTQYDYVIALDRFYLSKNSDETKFCTSDYSNISSANTNSKVGKWETDIDTDMDACMNVFSYRWTSKSFTSPESSYGPCCGDDQRSPLDSESYADELAGCWKGEYALNDSLVYNKTILYLDKEFVTCRNQNLRNNLTGSNPSETVQDSSTALNEQTLCKNRGSWYCDSNSKWDDALKYNRTQPVSSLKFMPSLSTTGFSIAEQVHYVPSEVLPDLSVSACCPKNYCWTGLPDYTAKGGCVPAFSNPQSPPMFKEYGETGFRCNNTGNWNVVSIKKDFNHKYSGYCNQNTDCFTNEKRQCYHSGEWDVFGDTDRMCLNGNWTTRTKYIAAKLMEYANNLAVGTDYSLYCDKAEKSLGVENGNTNDFTSLNYPVNFSTDQARQWFNDYMGLPSETALFSLCNGRCVNSFCVLRFKEPVGAAKIIVGTSLNKPFDTAVFPIQEAFGFTQADFTGAELSGPIEKIYQSSSSGKLFYSKDMQAMFYSIDTNILDLEPSIGDEILHFLLNPLITISNFIKEAFTGSDAESFSIILNEATDFDRVYFAQKGSKSITGMIETKFINTTGLEGMQTYLSANYTGFTDDICAAVEGNLPCETKGNSQYIYAVSSSESQFNEIWPDLTAKIRLQ